MDAARAAYEGYADFTGGKTFDGRQMPKWDDLTPRIRDAWRAAVHGVDIHRAEIEISHSKYCLERLKFHDAEDRKKGI